MSMDTMGLIYGFLQGGSAFKFRVSDDAKSFEVSTVLYRGPTRPTEADELEQTSTMLMAKNCVVGLKKKQQCQACRDGFSIATKGIKLMWKEVSRELILLMRGIPIELIVPTKQAEFEEIVDSFLKATAEMTAAIERASPRRGRRQYFAGRARCPPEKASACLVISAYTKRPMPLSTQG